MTMSNLMIGLPTMLLCLIIQVVIAFLNVRYLVWHLVDESTGRSFFSGIRLLLISMLIILLGNLLQIVLWGTLFFLLAEFVDLYEAIYHSAVNFTTLGYGDIVMSKHWKLLGPLEAVNGVLMLGMSSAALVVILQHLIKAKIDHRIQHKSTDLKDNDTGQ